MILSEDQFLFYKERTYPNLHNPFGWYFAISSNNTKKMKSISEELQEILKL